LTSRGPEKNAQSMEAFLWIVLERRKIPCYPSRCLLANRQTAQIGRWRTEMSVVTSRVQQEFIENHDRRKRMAGKRLTKAQVIAELANAADLDKKSVNRVFDAISELIRKQLSNRGPGEFVVPGLVKLRVVKKPATKERQGINPFTKEPITIPAKPASRKIRSTPLKALKDLVN
jgi:DNA-binding protein HU-beta